MSPNKIMELQKEYQERAHALQKDFETKRQVAQARGDASALQQASHDFQAASLNLVAWYNHKLNEVTQTDAPTGVARPHVTDEEMNIYSHEHCTVNLNQLAYRGDRNQMRKFLNDVPFAALVRDITSRHPIGNVHKKLLARSMRLTRQVAPELFDILDSIKDTLGLNVEPELFAVQDQHFNAGVYPLSNGRIPLYLTSGLLEKFTTGELTFVLAHELAHALLDHFRIPVNLLLNCAPHDLSPTQIIRLRAWERASEISADRLGLYCCKNFDDAASAFFKLSSGIVSDKFRFKVDDYMGQFRDLESYLKSAAERDIEDVYSSHPFSPIRLKALQLFHRSELYPQPTTPPISRVDVEREIQSFMKLTEPTYLDDSSDVAKAIREFIFYCGFLLARADGDIEQAELNQLASFLDPATITQGLNEVQSLTEQQLVPLILQRAEILNRELPVVTKLNVIRDLSTVVYADGKITNDEMIIMGNICNTLQIDPMFSVEVLPNLEAA